MVCLEGNQRSEWPGWFDVLYLCFETYEQNDLVLVKTYAVLYAFLV